MKCGRAGSINCRRSLQINDVACWKQCFSADEGFLRPREIKLFPSWAFDDRWNQLFYFYFGAAACSVHRALRSGFLSMTLSVCSDRKQNRWTGGLTVNAIWHHQEQIQWCHTCSMNVTSYLISVFKVDEPDIYNLIELTLYFANSGRHHGKLMTLLCWSVCSNLKQTDAVSDLLCGFDATLAQIINPPCMTWKQKHGGRHESPSVALRGQSTCSHVLTGGNLKGVAWRKVSSIYQGQALIHR